MAVLVDEFAKAGFGVRRQELHPSGRNGLVENMRYSVMRRKSPDTASDERKGLVRLVLMQLEPC